MVAIFLYLRFLATHSPKGCVDWLLFHPVRTTHLAGLRWVRSSEDMTGYVVGIFAASAKGWSAYPVEARSPPVRIATWSWSTSLRALVSAVAVTPSVSSMISSIFRPATCRLISSRYSSVPLCMSLPSAEAAPVSGTRSPILMGPPWAPAGAGAVPADTSASSATNTGKRAIMTRASFRSAPATAERADDAVGSEQDHADVDGAENEEPSLGVHAHEVLEEHDDAGADRGTDERARAAERGHQERLDRRHELDVRGADEAVVVGPEDAGHSREGAGQHEGHVLVEPHVVAQGLHARLAPADAFEAQAEGRDDDEAEHRPDRGRDDEREVEERQR